MTLETRSLVGALTLVAIIEVAAAFFTARPALPIEAVMVAAFVQIPLVDGVWKFFVWRG